MPQDGLVQVVRSYADPVIAPSDPTYLLGRLGRSRNRCFGDGLKIRRLGEELLAEAGRPP